jgi:hypothetical protein
MQPVIVILIVVAAALSAAWRLAGVATRLQLLEALARRLGAGRTGAWFARRAQAEREALLGAGCGSCKSGSGSGKRPAGR